MNAQTPHMKADIPPQMIGAQNAPFGKVERMISRRYLGAKKKDGGVGLIAALSFICIMLAVAAMIIIMSIMNGFRGEMIRLTIGSEGHMYVASSSPQPTPDSVAQLERRVATVEGIEKVFEMTQANTMVQTSSGVTGVQVIGITPASMKDFALISDNLVLGSLDGFGEGRGQDNQVAMGSGVARQLNVTAGDTVVVYSPRVRASPMGSTPIRKTFTVGAIYEIGLLQADTLYMYMGLEQAQLLFNDGKTDGTLQIRLDNPDEIDAMVQKVANAAGEPLFIETWRDRNQSTATALRTEQIVMRMIFMIVVIIATFPVLSAMIMLVKNKSRDIAVLRTIGATQAGILRIFLMSGAAIGVLGTLAGLIFGILFCLNIEPIQKAIEFVSGAPLFPADVYGLSGIIPVKIVWTEVLGVAFWGFLITTLATYLPARNASKIDPVDALRYE
ncbi:lipoprotein-releasing ABC transporter permease subunit [Fretibacter rubidus]|uniref:lipoprotein-releasing ABC transporter permease subunit n=1 Tax=Fretibacter rubidus TaxID=570162 RepID=UPI00352B3138